MNKPKKAPPFDPTDAAILVRDGSKKLKDFTPDQALEIRRALQHTGALRTTLLRRQESTAKLPAAFHLRSARSA